MGSFESKYPESEDAHDIGITADLHTKINSGIKKDGKIPDMPEILDDVRIESMVNTVFTTGHTDDRACKGSDHQLSESVHPDGFQDPRSPSVGIIRTPICLTRDEQSEDTNKSDCTHLETQNLHYTTEITHTPIRCSRNGNKDAHLFAEAATNEIAFFDPRSPSVGITRTPICLAPDEPTGCNEVMTNIKALIGEINYESNDEEYIDSENHDPRSPSLDFERTPLKIPSGSNMCRAVLLNNTVAASPMFTSLESKDETQTGQNDNSSHSSISELVAESTLSDKSTISENNESEQSVEGEVDICLKDSSSDNDSEQLYPAKSDIGIVSDAKETSDATSSAKTEINQHLDMPFDGMMKPISTAEVIKGLARVHLTERRCKDPVTRSPLAVLAGENSPRQITVDNKRKRFPEKKSQLPRYRGTQKIGQMKALSSSSQQSTRHPQLMCTSQGHNKEN